MIISKQLALILEALDYCGWKHRLTPHHHQKSLHNQPGKKLMLDSNSTPSDVLIIGEGSLFDEGIAALLQRSTSLAVLHVVYSDEPALMKVVQRAEPDVILVCQSGSLNTKRIVDSISINPLMLGLCIFVVRLSSPIVDIYQQPIQDGGKTFHPPRNVLAWTTNDLINILSENI